MPRRRRVTGPQQGGTVFGECLGNFTKGVSVLTLATEAKLDSNLIYMWLRGERLPALNTDYVARLAKALRLSPSDEGVLLRALEQSRRSGRSHKRVPRAGIEAVRELLAAAWSGRGPTVSDGKVLDHMPLVGRQSVISGTENLILAATDLIARVPSEPQPAAADIYMTYYGSKSAFESHPDLLDYWNAAVSTALSKGYRVHALWRLDRNVARSIHLAKDTLALLGKGIGEYLPKYVVGGGVSDPPHDLLVIPKTGALLMYATTQSAQVDTAVRVSDPAQLEVLLHYARQCAAVSEPILTLFASDQGEASHRAGVAADIEAGRRIVLKNGLSTLTRPLSWFEHPDRIKRMTWRTNENFDIWVKRERERIPTFLEAARTGTFRDMCPQRAITLLLDKGKYYEWDGIKSVERDMGLAREHVEHLVWLLNNLDGYELGLLDDVETRTIGPRFCMVHGDSSVILEYDQVLDGIRKPVKMQITESQIVSAFREHLETLWTSVQLREKTECLEWLKKQLDGAR